MPQAYLICGDDEFRVSTATQELLAELVPPADREFGLDRVDGRVDTVDESVAALRAVRDSFVADGLFGGGERTVWFQEPTCLSNERIAKSKDVKEKLADLAAAVKNGLPDGVKLVISVSKVNRASALFKAIASTGEVKDFGNGLKAYQKAEAAAGLLAEYLPKVGLKMSGDVRTIFLARVGTDSRQIVSELQKLACYCGDGKEATAADVAEIVSSGAVSEIWDFVDAFSRRDPKALVRQIRIQLEQGENSIRMVSSLLTCVGQLLAVREAQDRKWATRSGASLSWNGLPEELARGFASSDKDVRTLIGFRLRKLLEQADLWTLRELRNARHYLLMLREDLVSLSIPESILLEMKLLQAIGFNRRHPGAK